MEQTAHERLAALAETYKQQKSKLSDTQSNEAAHLLAQAMASSAGPAYDTVEGFIRGLPADTTAKALGDSWLQQPEATRNHFLRTLPNLPRSDRFDRLKLLAAAAIVDVEPLSGLTFLCTACTSLAPRSGNHFAVEIVQVFRRTFLDGQDPRIHKLNITAHPSAVTAALLNLLAYCLLNTSPHAPTLPPVFQLPTVKWLFSSQAYNRLKPAHQTQLVETIKKWNTTLQEEVKRTLDLQPTGLPPSFEFLLAPPPQPIAPQPTTEESTRLGSVIPKLEKQALHWKDLLAALTSQINNIDQQLQAAREQAERDQAESETLRTALADAQTHIENLREELGKKAQENERNAASLSSAQGIACAAKQRAESLDATIAELQRTHEQEVRTLTSRVDTEAAQRLDTFKYNLARFLRVDYADFKMANGKPMTLELGEALRALLAAIFDHLQKQGINTRD